MPCNNCETRKSTGFSRLPAEYWENIINNSKTKLSEESQKYANHLILKLKDEMLTGWTRYATAGELNSLLHREGIL